MPFFKLNGQDLEFQPGDTVIKAAWRAGIEIPHYCWHPGLSIAANCRMCLVEVKSARPMMLPILRWDEQKKEYVEATKPKLVPACQQVATEGLEVSSESDEVKKAQRSVQEFLLLNHPVDCPICDQAGECKLQDYWLEHQATLKRKTTEPVHKVKGVRFGPTIVYDGERCVMCTRCIRFNAEVVGDPVLDMRERGNVNEIVLAPGRQLDHKYSLMNETVCPVGALTSRDFRFKARVWFLKSAPGVCTGCATGCNTWNDFDPRNQRVYRIRPRDNEAINRFWLCDDGMLSYRANSEGRVLLGGVASAPGAARRTVSAPEASLEASRVLSAAKRTGKSVGVVLSALHSTEDNWALAKLAKEVLGVSKLYLAARPKWDGDSILRHEDANPNRAGATEAARAFGFDALATTADLIVDVESGVVGAVLALGQVAEQDAASLRALAKVPTVVLAANEGPLTAVAAVLVPVAAHAETAGSFTNAKGLAQQWKRAVAPPPGVVSAWEAIAELANRMGTSLGVKKLDDVRRALPAPAPVTV